MAAEKACRKCRTIFEGAKCPVCGEGDGLDTFKGKIVVLNPEESELAGKLGIKNKGTFAIKLR